MLHRLRHSNHKVPHAPLSRRDFIAASAAVPIAAALTPGFAQAATPPIALRAESRIIEVNGKAASKLHIGRKDGVSGIFTEAGRRFHVTLENRLKDDKTLIHWHGLTPDYKQDGVPNVSQPALEPGELYEYDFPLTFPGTFWMHSHYEESPPRITPRWSSPPGSASKSSSATGP